MSVHLDYAEISRHARRIVDANRARSVLQQTNTGNPERPRKRVKFRRTTTGCLSCRQHKVKCDETLPACLRCVAAQRICEYPAARASDGVKRRKRRKSKEDRGVHEEGSERGDRKESGRLVGEGVKGAGGPSTPSRGVSTAVKKLDGKANDGMKFDLSPSEVFNIPLSSSSPSPTPKAPPPPPSDLAFLNDFIPNLKTNFPPTLPNSPHGNNRHPPTNQPDATFLQLPDLHKSVLLSRRVRGKDKGPSPIVPSLSTTTSSSILPRIATIDGLLHAFAFDDAIFEFGPSHRQKTLSSAGITHVSTDVLSNAFPSPIARTIFHHYCNVASRILITMGNIGPNPLLALCTPLRLLDTTSATSAAMRMSMLSISVAHFAHETEQVLGVDVLGGTWIGGGQKKQLKRMSEKFKKAALSNLTLATTTDASTQHVDCILAACLLICIRDVISADSTWRDNLEFALNLINKNGGPRVMLQPSVYSFTRRYLLENLATHDVFSSFITGKEPALLGNYDLWWFDSVETSTNRWEWESVERSFGISRAMVDLVARIAALDSRKRRLGISLKGPPDELWDAGQHFLRESHCLLLELDIWGNSLNCLPQHFRVTCGDYIYKYMSVVFILGDILEQPTSTPRIVSSINHVLELCSEASAMRMSVMLIWPLLIAGVFCLSNTRDKVRELFEAYHSDYCEDLEAAKDLLEEQWRCIDAGQGKQPWNVIMKKLNKYVLLI